MTVQLIPIVVLPSLLVTFTYLVLLRHIAKHLFETHPHSPGNAQADEEARD